jgi:hypothetical protein
MYKRAIDIHGTYMRFVSQWNLLRLPKIYEIIQKIGELLNYTRLDLSGIYNECLNGIIIYIFGAWIE